ncbi:MAG: CDP-diacylglycerol--serine O-phosphatidyltransferase [Candidatus Hydrogenedentes bacterium]|nr:CDP-diacylglycerol--serine O-phosphatidyltransferase [Candidatus Hydrogenedentota bacterium]
MPKFKRKRNLRRRPINVLASGLTTLGLYCGIASIFYAIRGDYKSSVYLIFCALLIDILDGTVAKLTKTTSEFGKQLDSLCDVVSFGVAPAVLIFSAFLKEAGEPESVLARFGAVLAVIFVICGALRLARFNVYQSRLRDYFVGLPIPAAAATVASFVLFTHYFEVKVVWVLAPMVPALSYLMVSTVRYPKDKMKSFVLAPRNAFRLLALSVMGIGVVHFASDHSPAIIFFPVALGYVLFGICDEFYQRVHRKQPRLELYTPGAEPPVGGAPPESPPAKTGDVL